MHREKEALNLYDIYYPDGLPNPQTQCAFQHQSQSVNKDMRESSYQLFQGHYPHGLFNPESQLAFYNHQAQSLNKDIDDSTYTLFQQRYSYGLPDPQPQTHTSSGDQLPALHKTDDSITPGGYQIKKSPRERYNAENCFALS